MVAAAPAWFADNLLPIAGGTLAILTVLILRMIQKAALRTTLLVIVGAVALFVYVNRDPLEACARTCECRIADRDIHVPTCQSDLDL